MSERDWLEGLRQEDRDDDDDVPRCPECRAELRRDVLPSLTVEMVCFTRGCDFDGWVVE